MWPASIVPVTLLFIFSLLTPLDCANPFENLSTDIINQTCETCADLRILHLNSSFCSSSLGSVPVSHEANLGGLGLVAMELALENATDTVSIISSMLERTTVEPRCDSCLTSCLELYSSMRAKLEACIVDFLFMQYETVYLWVSTIKQATTICEWSFEGEGAPSPLTEENYSLSQLCGIVLCIIELMNPASIEAVNSPALSLSS